MWTFDGEPIAVNECTDSGCGKGNSSGCGGDSGGCGGGNRSSGCGSSGC